MRSIFDYTLSSITRYGYKNLALICIFSFLVFLLSSAMMIANSLNLEYKTISKNFPEIIVQKSIGGRNALINSSDMDKFWEYPSISSIEGRVWGQYYFERNGVYLTLFGVKSFNDYYQDEIKVIAETFPENKNLMIASPEVLDFFEDDINTYGGVPFFTYDGRMIKVGVGGEFKFKNSLENGDLILLDENVTRQILGIPEPFFTDFVVRVPNSEESELTAGKIHLSDPSLKVTTKYKMLQDYQLLYDYKSGWFLLLLMVAFVAYAIILYDKASGLRSEERREIGILKAIGWEISHIIRYKLTEAVIMSVMAFLIGVIVAIFYVYGLGAPILISVFSGNDPFKFTHELMFSVDFKLMSLLFFTTVPLYIAVCIIPAWKVASSDAGEILR